MRKNKFLFLLAVYFCATQFAAAKKDTVSVESAFVSKKIKLEIKGLGGFQGEVISMKIKNLAPDSIVVHVESGRRLDNKDSSQQDILVVKDEFLSLAKGQEKKLTVTGFCCQAHNGAPNEKSVFLVGSLAGPKLYDVARYLSLNKFSKSVIQNAIWAISDSNEISSIYDDGSEAVTELRKYIAKLRGIEVPWYSTAYKKEPGQIFSGVPERVTGMVDYYVTADLAFVAINIRDEQGTVVKNFPGGRGMPRGAHVFNMDWKTLGLPKGKYYLRIFENSRKLKEIQIDLK